MILDSQVHIWAPSTPERPWPPLTKPPHRSNPLGAGELLEEMDVAGVARAILISPSWEGIRNDVVLAAARAHPDRFAVMGRIDYEAPDASEALEDLAFESGVLGFRVTFHTPQLQQGLAAGRYDWLWKAAERLAKPLMIYAPHSVLHHIEPVAERHPELRLAMCHLSIPILTKDETAFAGLDNLLRLARFPNVAAKASALPGHSSMPYPYPNLHPPLRRVLEAFGERRLFWGTDFSKLPCTYTQAIAMFSREMPWLTAEQKRWVMGEGAREWFSWK
jgi:predicted TIM-barrel fold metal-dependent hydrolase